jgi:amino acid permease
MRSSGLRAIGWILLLVGLAAIVVGVVYFTVAADKLPSFLGHLAHVSGHRTKRGTAAVIVGVILWLGAAVAFVRAGRAPR